MTKPHLPGDYVPVFVELPSEPLLVAAANAVLQGEDPSEHIKNFAHGQRDRLGDFIIDPSFGAVPVGKGTEHETGDNWHIYLNAEGADRLLVSGWVSVADGPPEHILDKQNNVQCPVYANPPTGGLLDPCLPTCGTSRPVGIAPSGVDPRPLPVNIKKIPDNLKVPALGSALDGSGVAIAIVDSGINIARLEHLLDEILF